MDGAPYRSVKEGAGTLLIVSTFNHERAPMLCLQRLNALKANNWTNNYIQRNHQWLQSWVLTAHNTLNGTISPWAWCSSRCTPHYTFVYRKISCSNFRWSITRNFLPQICIVLEAVLLKLRGKLASGWALVRVNFGPIQEIGPKVGGGHSFVSECSFAPYFWQWWVHTTSIK